MRLKDFLDRYITKKTKIGGTVTVDIPPEIYYMEMALYTGISLIGNAISKCEIKTYVNGKEEKGEDYFTLNFSPNPNENATKFWHKVINKMIREKTALVIEENGNLYCADSWYIETENSLYGNTYAGVTIGEFTFDKKFRARDVYLFEMDDTEVSQIIGGMYDSFGRLLVSSMKSYQRSNGQKMKLKVKDVKAGDPDFNEEFKNIIEKNLEKFMGSDNAVYPEFEGYELVRMDREETNATAADVLQIKSDWFDTIGKALKIPCSLMAGNVNNTKEVVKAFLTFGVDPIADMIGETLTKRVGVENYRKGNFYKVSTNKINHIDLFEIAPNIDKLIASGGFCIDEIRKEADYQEIEEPWSRTHWMTKNYETIEKILKELMGGEEESE